MSITGNCKRTTGLAPSLQHLSALTHLQLQKNSLDFYEMAALGPALQQLTGLRQL